MLRPGGTLVVSVPHAGLLGGLDSLNLYARLRPGGDAPTDDPSWALRSHHRHFSVAELAGLLGPAFEVDAVHRTGVGIAELLNLPLLLATRGLSRRLRPLYAVLQYAYFGAYVLEDLLPAGRWGYHLMVRARRRAAGSAAGRGGDEAGGAIRTGACASVPRAPARGDRPRAGGSTMVEQTGLGPAGAGQPAPREAPLESLAALAEPESRLDRLLQLIPRALSSKLHVILLMGLGLFLVVLPLLGVAVSAQAELIGGNYTNVTSDIGACIAAGGTLHLVRQGRHRHRIEEERLRLTRQLHELMFHVHAREAAELQGRTAD